MSNWQGRGFRQLFESWCLFATAAFWETLHVHVDGRNVWCVRTSNDLDVRCAYPVSVRSSNLLGDGSYSWIIVRSLGEPLEDDAGEERDSL